MKRILIVIMLLLLTSCTDIKYKQSNIDESNYTKEAVQSANRTDGIEVIKSDLNEEMESRINKNGSTVQERIRVPEGFERVKAEKNSYAQYLRDLPVKPDGTKIKLYNGEVMNKDVHVAVLDIDVGTRDLQQCADAIIRLRAEYLYGQVQMNTAASGSTLTWFSRMQEPYPFQKR